MIEYLTHREAIRPVRAPYKHRHLLEAFWRWLQSCQLDPLHVTAEDLQAYQHFIAEEHVSAKGARLSPASQVRRLTAVRAYYRFLERRHIILTDVSGRIRLPRVKRYVTRRDYFSLQEITALLQTQAQRVNATPRTKLKWAIEMRDLAFLSLAVATGRRLSGLRDLRLCDLDFERDEVRVEYEKGKTGRILPVAHWAMVVAKEYLEQARPRFKTAQTSEHFFVSKRTGRVTHQIEDVLPLLLAQTIEQNPDLTELPGKTLTMHGLRVTFAKLLFNGGCNLRSVNELMLHDRLSTTAYYTPVKLEELRGAFRLAHPRA
jgi:integrase/recombinase XerD